MVDFEIVLAWEDKVEYFKFYSEIKSWILFGLDFDIPKQATSGIDGIREVRDRISGPKAQDACFGGGIERSPKIISGTGYDVSGSTREKERIGSGKRRLEKLHKAPEISTNRGKGNITKIKKNYQVLNIL